jgi:hypothetical protein
VNKHKDGYPINLDQRQRGSAPGRSSNGHPIYISGAYLFLSATNSFFFNWLVSGQQVAGAAGSSSSMVLEKQYEMKKSKKIFFGPKNSLVRLNPLLFVFGFGEGGNDEPALLHSRFGRLPPAREGSEHAEQSCKFDSVLLR